MANFLRSNNKRENLINGRKACCMVNNENVIFVWIKPLISYKWNVNFLFNILLIYFYQKILDYYFLIDGAS